jgi:hypothetical protein
VSGGFLEDSIKLSFLLKDKNSLRTSALLMNQAWRSLTHFLRFARRFGNAKGERSSASVSPLFRPHSTSATTFARGLMVQDGSCMRSLQQGRQI